MLSTVLFVCAMFVLTYIAIILHELGHYAIVRWYGYTAQWFKIGVGRELIRFRHCGSWFHFNAIPLSGEVALAPGHLFQMGYFGATLVFAAGPLVNIITGGLVLWYVDAYSWSELNRNIWPWILQVSDLPEVFGRMSIYLGLFNLFPYKTKKSMSDGYWIRRLWRQRHEFDRLKNKRRSV